MKVGYGIRRKTHERYEGRKCEQDTNFRPKPPCSLQIGRPRATNTHSMTSFLKDDYRTP